MIRRNPFLLLAAACLVGVFALSACTRVPEAVVAPAGLGPLNCELWKDSAGVSHVRAPSEAAILACWGYVHARDRGWQMDYFRRITQGRNAEIYGKDSIRTDFAMRLFGLYAEAERVAAELRPEDRKRLEAYAYGANRGFEVTRSPEFKELGYKPEGWRPADSIAVLLLQSLDQTRESFEHDIKEEHRPTPFPTDGLPWDTSILKAGEFVPAQARATASLGPGEVLDQPGPSEGSNNWIVSGKRSVSRHPWLANDPHLKLSNPPMWYPIAVSGPDLGAIGLSLPGAPVIASGANTKMAWGLTNSYLDVGDVASVPDGDLHDLQSFLPKIWFKWGPFQIPFFFKRFSRTQEGWPLLPLEKQTGNQLVVRWSGFDLHGADMAGLFDLISAKNVAEMDHLFAGIGLTGWNFVFADTQGGIGYRAIGKVPRRTAPPSLGVSKRNLQELRSWEYLTPEEMPHVLNPGRGYVVTANNRQWPVQAQLNGGRAYSNGARAFRIEELIEAKTKHDAKSLQAIQCDVQEVEARFLLPELLRRTETKFRQTHPALFDALRAWDYLATPECRVCGLYRRWVEQIKHLLNTNEGGIYIAIKDKAMTQDRSSLRVQAALELGFEHAVAELGKDNGRVLQAWGKSHHTHFHHLSGHPLSAERDVSTPGDTNTVNAGNENWTGKEFDHTDGPSARTLIELTSPPRVRLILADPDRPEPWARCELGVPENGWDHFGSAPAGAERLSL